MAAPDDAVRVSCVEAADGWRCEVVVGDDPGATSHTVTVPAASRERLAPGRDPSELVKASFGFLLEREPRTSILRAFELEVIGRYFPDYPDEIRRRMA